MSQLCISEFMWHVPSSAGLQPPLLTMTFPPSRWPCFSHSPPLTLSIPKSLCSAISSLLPLSLHRRLCHPLIHPSPCWTGWFLGVLDTEHGKGLHKYPIHHHGLGQLKPCDTYTIDSVVCWGFSHNTHTKYTEGKQTVKYEHSTVHINNTHIPRMNFHVQWEGTPTVWTNLCTMDTRETVRCTKNAHKQTSSTDQTAM